MKKSQWYIFSAGFLVLMFLFTGLARNRKNICESGASMVYDFCMQRHTVFISLAFVFLVLMLIFFISSLLNKK